MYVFYLKKWAIHSFPLFWWAMWANRSGRSPKMSDVSKSLRSLTKNEQPWVNRSGRSTKMSKWLNCSFFWANCSIAHFRAKNKWFARKTDERIPSPAIISTVLLGLKVYSYNIFVGISRKYFKILSMCWDRICLGLFFFFISIYI